MSWDVFRKIDGKAGNSIFFSVRKLRGERLVPVLTLGPYIDHADKFIRQYCSLYVGKAEHEGSIRIALDANGDFTITAREPKRPAPGGVLRLPKFWPFTGAMDHVDVPYQITETEIVVDLREIWAGLKGVQVPPVQKPVPVPAPACAPEPQPNRPYERKTPYVYKPRNKELPKPAPVKPPPVLVQKPAPPPPPPPAPIKAAEPPPPPSTHVKDEVPPPWEGQPSEMPKERVERVFESGKLNLIGDWLFWNLREKVRLSRDEIALIKPLLGGRLMRHQARAILPKKDIDLIIGDIRGKLRSLPTTSIKTLSGSSGWEIAA